MTTTRRILMLEDDDMLGEMLKTLLGMRNFEVFIMKESRGLFELIARENIQLILMDKVLQSEDGLEICERLKNNKETAHIPVMMMSGHHDLKDTCIAAGASGFIAKPFDVKSFISTIEEMWNTRS